MYSVPLEMLNSCESSLMSISLCIIVRLADALSFAIAVMNNGRFWGLMCVYADVAPDDEHAGSESQGRCDKKEIMIRRSAGTLGFASFGAYVM